MSAACRFAARRGSWRLPSGLVAHWKALEANSADTYADRVADAWIKAQAYRLHTFGTVTRVAAGGELGAESSVTKVFWSDLDVAIHQTALDLRGADGELADSWTDGLLFALGGPIYAGTNEIQRNIIAERSAGAAAGKLREVEMKFDLDEQQRDFAASIDAALASADLPAAVRAWAQGDTAPGRKVWAQLADLGVTALAVPEKFDGIEAHPVDLVVAAERLGRWCVPGPVTESIAVAPVLLADDDRSAALATGELIATVAMPPQVPRAVDADTAGLILVASRREATARSVTVPRVSNTSPSIRAESCSTSPRPARAEPPTSHAHTSSVRWPRPRSWSEPDRRCWTCRSSTPSSAASSAERSGHTRRSSTNSLMCTSPSSSRARWCTAPHYRWPTVPPTPARDVSAAKVAAADAALLAARSALQTHGAIGFTQEHDLSLWLLRVQALRSAWGDPTAHRRRLLEAL